MRIKCVRLTSRAARFGVAPAALIAALTFIPAHFVFTNFANAQQPSPAAAPPKPAVANPPAQTPASTSAATQQPPSTQTTPSAQQTQRPATNIVVLDAAHGGTDPGARGASGIRESDLNLYFAAQVKIALESNGFQVIQTRQGNEEIHPSTIDSALQDSQCQRGAFFVSIHVGSTGLPGTVRVYVMSDLPTAADTNGLIPWDRAQAPFLPLSRRFGDMVQGFLAQRFKGSPQNAQSAAVRQLRTTAAPAIAVEIASVAVEDRNTLDRMAPGIADAIARGASGFRPLYVVAAVNPGDRP